jgi:DNA polymerase (family X)
LIQLIAIPTFLPVLWKGDFMIVATQNTTLRHNKELASIFRRMSDCYKYLGAEHRFRAIAYETAAKTLSNLSEPVDAFGHDIKKLDQ